jgi:hypothetical protein
MNEISTRRENDNRGRVKERVFDRRKYVKHERAPGERVPRIQDNLVTEVDPAHDECLNEATRIKLDQSAITSKIPVRYM